MVENIAIQENAREQFYLLLEMKWVKPAFFSLERFQQNFSCLPILGRNYILITSLEVEIINGMQIEILLNIP